MGNILCKIPNFLIQYEEKVLWTSLTLSNVSENYIWFLFPLQKYPEWNLLQQDTWYCQRSPQRRSPRQRGRETSIPTGNQRGRRQKECGRWRSLGHLIIIHPVWSLVFTRYMEIYYIKLPKFKRKDFLKMHTELNYVLKSVCI